MDSAPEQHIAHCSACGCKMDISAMEPYTNVVCPDCAHHTRVKCELGQYLLTDRHAAGGMSMVFKARDTTLDREVAIKVLNEDYSRDETRMKQFEHEALITAAISHPHVVRVFTVGKNYDCFYIAMEMVSGESLEQKMSGQDALKEDEMLPITAEIISGLRAAKQAGLIHRDMKPGNILFDSMGHVKIVDFGLALVTQGGKAKAEEIWATPYYVPPEALDGEEEDFRSDIYALGATLYHCLSGNPPFSNPTHSTREVRKAKESILPLAEVAPWLKPETCYLVDRAMALRPEDRFSSYAEMDEASSAAYQAVKGMGASEPIRSRERAQRRVTGGRSGLKLKLILTGGVALILVGVAGAIFLKKGKEDEPPPSIAKGEGAPVEVLERGDYDPEVAAGIAQKFRTSHQMLKEKKNDQAKVVFAHLMNDEAVREPAASWAGVEAVIATWLGGHSGDARLAITDLQKHLESHEVSNNSPVGELGDQLASPGMIRDVTVGDDIMGVVHLMAVALKNWEVGAWDLAAPLFGKVMNHDVPKGSPLRVYREIAQRYLSDYESLKPLSEAAPSEDLDVAKQRLLALNKALENLQTRGRAKFHIRIWQVRTHRKIKEMEGLREKTVSEVPQYSSVMPKVRELIAQSKFAEASEVLQGVQVEKGQTDDRDSWIYLADSASAFLGGVEVGVPSDGVAMEVNAVDGKIYQKVIASKPGGIRLQGADGEKFLTWAEVTPVSVLAIHQKLFKQTLSTLEGQLRTEQAVCYAWLSGMDQKAKLAANKLSEVNEDFKKRWAHTMQVHHGSP